MVGISNHIVGVTTVCDYYCEPLYRQPGPQLAEL